MAGKISTSDVLNRTACELESLSEATRDLEQTVTQLVRSETAQATVVSLQSFDLVAQTLAALTDFIREVGDQIGASHQTDIALATHNIKLGDLRARLTNADQKTLKPTPPELF